MFVPKELTKEKGGGIPRTNVNKERTCWRMKRKIVQPGPDLSSPGVGALWLPLEEVWRRPDLNWSKLVGTRIRPWGSASFLIGQPARMDEGGLLCLFITLAGLGFPPTF